MAIKGKNAYPENIGIGSGEWTIVFKDNIDNNSSTLGLCDGGTNEIFIKNGQSPRETLETFLHEIIHAMEIEYSLVVSHKSVYVLQMALTDFIVSNFNHLLRIVGHGKNIKRQTIYNRRNRK